MFHFCPYPELLCVCASARMSTVLLAEKLFCGCRKSTYYWVSSGSCSYLPLSKPPPLHVSTQTCFHCWKFGKDKYFPPPPPFNASEGKDNCIWYINLKVFFSLGLNLRRWQQIPQLLTLVKASLIYLLPPMLRKSWQRPQQLTDWTSTHEAL